MNTAVADRMCIAERILQVYANCPNSIVGFVFGSVGNGFADKYSDLEIGVIWNSAPEESDLREICESVGGTDWTYSGFHEEKLGYGDDYKVEGLQIEPAHWTMEIIDRVIKEVMEEHDVSMNGWMYERQAMLATLQRGKVGFGEEALTEIRERFRTYPKELSVKMVMNNLAFGNLEALRMLAKRREVPLFQSHLVNRIRNLYGILYGLNKVYVSSFKWNRYFFDEFSFIPSSFVKRVDALFENPPETSVEIYANLVEDTLGLIEEHLPEAITSDAKNRFYEETRVWSPSPDEESKSNVN